jgi:rhodanese-related sulfurtransferase
MKKFGLLILAVAILLLISFLPAYAYNGYSGGGPKNMSSDVCDSCSDGGPQYKTLSLDEAPGYFAKEFDKVAPTPGMDWDNEILSIWFAGAAQKGWVVKTSPPDAIPGAIILGFDRSNNAWVGIVREVDNKKITFEALDDKGRVVQNRVDIENLNQEYGLFGYIWPRRTTDSVQEISLEKAMEAWKNKDALFIDVRAPEKYKQGHIPGAVSIPLLALKGRLKEIPKEKRVLLICGTGQGSSQANLILQSYGFKNTASVTGGMLEWRGGIEK